MIGSDPNLFKMNLRSDGCTTKLSAYVGVDMHFPDCKI